MKQQEDAREMRQPLLDLLLLLIQYSTIVLYRNVCHIRLKQNLGTKPKENFCPNLIELLQHNGHNHKPVLPSTVRRLSLITMRVVVTYNCHSDVEVSTGA